MLFANDHNDNKIFIDNINSNEEYYCPYCGTTLIVKNGGKQRQHHFAHPANHECSDSWEREHNYDTSEWHNKWQNKFPKDNQEIKLELDSVKHRADVIIDKTVVEFQHSILSADKFDDRNNFYMNLGYKVVWLFDFSDLFSDGKITEEINDDNIVFKWNFPKKIFNRYDINSGTVDLFFQLKKGIDSDECIIKINSTSSSGFELFEAKKWITKINFMEYVGLHDDICNPPYYFELTEDKIYIDFKKKYGIILNKQQERALQAIDGYNLILAVPGSGKTTVLISRLGYMTLCKGINPSKILAVTYNKSAAEEMCQRFSDKFGSVIGSKINFRTINSLALSIYHDYCNESNKSERTLIEEKDRQNLIRSIFRKFNPDEYPSDTDISDISTVITYVKNMMIPDAQLDIYNKYVKEFSSIYKDYQNHMNTHNLMDFDDQLIFAESILSKRPSTLAKWQGKFDYICVDEAQDTSKIQHTIINLLSQKNNLFMVGDEDQSIYGFRAAYPKALLNFRYDYPNPYILRMETNYRSTKKIVNLAQTFISRNKGRYEKNMVPSKEEDGTVDILSVNSKRSQYLNIIEIVQNRESEIAFLYRDNETAVAIIDLLTKNGIDFSYKKSEYNFFDNKLVKDIISYFELSMNPYNYQAFDQICNKGIVYLKKQQKEYLIKNCKLKKIKVIDSLKEQEKYIHNQGKNPFKTFIDTINRVSLCTNPVNAIELIEENGYDKYISESKLDSGKLDILKSIASGSADKESFITRLKELNQICGENHYCNEKNPVILSTIHSSKGLEYENVYLVDIYNGRFPSSTPNIFERSKDNSNGEMEERRLFYVGMTRAKRSLHLFNIGNKNSDFISELKPAISNEIKNYNLVATAPISGRKVPEEVNRMITQKVSFIGTTVTSSEFGEGVITDCTNNIITVQYNSNTLKYAVPLAFSMGTIKLKE